MADKDDFKFDDDDTFPETDLSGAFSEGEQAASQEPDYPMTIKKSGGSKTRLLLVMLLLIVAGGGAYYFFLMEEPAPPPRPPAKKVVVAPVAAPVAAPVTVSVAPPPKPATPAPALVAAPAPVVTPAKPPVVAVPPPKPATPAPAQSAAPTQVVTPVKVAPTIAPTPITKPVEVKPAVVSAVTGGPWLVEAGTYLNATTLKAVEKKIRALGYEPQVSTMQKSVRMTRLRLGSFPESELKEALADARGIAPEAFALRAGETFTVYAGTFTNPQNIRELTQRLVNEGVKVEEEPLEVKRTISLVRFGGFTDQTAAAEAVTKARKAGIAAEVVSPR